MKQAEQEADLKILEEWRLSRKKRLPKSTRQALIKVMLAPEMSQRFLESYRADYERSSQADRALEECLVGLCLRKRGAGDTPIDLLSSLIELRSGDRLAKAVRHLLLFARKKITEEDIWAALSDVPEPDADNGIAIISRLLALSPDTHFRLLAGTEKLSGPQQLARLRWLLALLKQLPKGTLSRKPGLRASLLLVRTVADSAEREKTSQDELSKLRERLATTTEEAFKLRADLKETMRRTTEAEAAAATLQAEVSGRTAQVQRERQSFETTNRYEKNRLRAEIRDYFEKAIQPNLHDIETTLKSYEAKDPEVSALALAIIEKLSRATKKLLEQLKDE